MGKELDKGRDTASPQQQPQPHAGPSPGSSSRSSGLTAPTNPVASGLVPVESPQRRAEPTTKPSPDSGVDWSAVWADNKPNLVRHVLEPTRMIPGLGLLTGWSADLIEGAQNKDSLKDVEQTKQGARFQTAMAARQGLVVFNNALGHIRYLGTLGQDAAISSVVGSWLAPFTGEVNEVLNAVNLGTNGLQLYFDTGIAVAARMEQSKHDPDSKAYAAYHGLWQNFAVNGVTDGVGILLDIADLATGSLANASVIKQVKGAITATTKSAEYMKLQLLPLIKNWVGVWGPSVWKALEGGYKKKPEPTGDQTLGAQVGPHGVTRAVAGKIMMNEIAEIRSAVRIGTPFVERALGLPGQTARDVGRVIQHVGGAKEPFIWLRNKLAAGIKDGSARVSKMLEMTTTASQAERAARKASAAIDTAVTAVGRLHMPTIAVPEQTNLGDGALAKGAAKIVDGAKHLGAGAVTAATQKIQSAIDAAKQPILQQATEIKSELAWSVEFTAELQRTINEQTAKFREQGAQFSAQLARCGNVEDIFKLLFDAGAKVMGAPEFAVDQLKLDWIDIRTNADHGATVAREVASGGPTIEAQPLPKEGGAR
jgi:hypothetical protein